MMTVPVRRYLLRHRAFVLYFAVALYRDPPLLRRWQLQTCR